MKGVAPVPVRDGWASAVFLELSPLLAAADLGWQDEALCAQVDGEIFYPEKGGSTLDAKRVCMACPVREPCLEYALDRDERFGIWGGYSERERRRLKRRPAAGPVQAASGFKGVFPSRSGRWIARVSIGDRRVYVGTFDSPEAASRAVADAEASASPDPEHREAAA